MAESNAERFRAVLEAYEQWEADLLMCGEAWSTPSGLPRMTQALYDRWMEIQAMRNDALGRLNPDGSFVRSSKVHAPGDGASL